MDPVLQLAFPLSCQVLPHGLPNWIVFFGVVGMEEIACGPRQFQCLLQWSVGS